MTKKTYYIENTSEAREILYGIQKDFPLFYSAKIVEMDYLEVTLEMRNEDAAAVEKRLAPIV
jgi:hypothetical protein